MAEQPKYFDIEDTQTGKKYRIETDDPNATYDEAVEYFSALPETEWQQYEYNVPAPADSVPAPVAPAFQGQITLQNQLTDEQAAQRLADAGRIQEGDYNPAGGKLPSFAPENNNLTKLQERQLLSLLNANSTKEQVNRFLSTIGREYTDAEWAQIEEQRKTGNPFGGVAGVDAIFDGMVDKEKVFQEYAPEGDGVFKQVGRSIVEAYSDPASLMNFLNRKRESFFDVYEEELKAKFPDATPEQLADLENQYIGYIARMRGQAASEAVKDDDFIPWLIGQFLAVEPTDVFIPARAARAATKTGRVLEKGIEGATIGASTDLLGQNLAVYDQAQDEVDFVRTGFSAALSAGLGVGAQGVAEIVPGVKVNTPETAPPSGRIVAPTSRKNSKKYKEELDTAGREMVSHINELTRGWTNAPDIEVHDNFAKLDGVSDTAIGVYTEKTLDDGTKVPVVKVNAEAVLERARKRDTTPEAVVEAVTFHEALGHHGLTQLFREDLDAFLDDIYTNGSEQFRDKVDTWLNRNPRAYSTYDETSRRILATEEVMAEWSEGGPLARSFYDNVANYIKDFARTKLGMDLKYTEREVKAFLAVAHERVQAGDRGGATPSAPRNMIVYHGSPYDFERFDHSYMGRGEGNQVFGWGSYFTSKKSIAEGAYRDRLSEEKVSFNGVEAPVYVLRDNVKQYAELEDISPEVADAAFSLWQVDRYDVTPEKIYDEWAYSVGQDFPDAYLELPDDWKVTFEKMADIINTKMRVESSGKLYEVDLPDDAKWLEWEEPISSQPELAKVLADEGIEVPENRSGELGYRLLAEKLTPRGASERLSEAGFAGNRYVANNLRKNRGRKNDGTDVFNYVVFDDKTPKIVNKYMEGDGPIDPDNLTADDLIKARNPLDLLNRLDYTPTVVSPDQLEAEAIARNLPPSAITRLVGMEPGKLMKKLFLYDVAATKLSDKAAKIKEDIDINGLTPEKQAAYIETTMTLSDLTSRIFDFQGEIGRTLAANRRVNFSRKRVRDLKSVLEKYGVEALADPETFIKYMAEVEAKTAKKDGKAQFGTGFAQYVNIPRAIMSSADLSAPLRQGIVFIGYKEFWKSFAKMFSLFGKSGESNYNFLMKKIATDPNYELMLKARLQFSSLDGELTAREEDFQTELARKIPLYGKVVKGSEQAYAGFLNKLRADMFNRFVKEYKDAGIELDEEGLKGLGRFINAATGRAELPEFLKPSSTILNATFFSARLMHSRVQMLNPAFYAKLPAPVRKSAGKAMLRFGSIALLVNGALNALFPEAETELDPRSSDFMKVKVGNTRFDLGGGFNQYLILGARTGTWLYNQSLGFGERMTGIDTTDYRVANKKTVGGDYRDFGAEGMTQDTYGSVLADFFRSKLSPQASYVVDFLNEEDYIGRPFTVEGSLASRLVPMTASSVYEAYAEDSPAPMPVIFTATLFGVGTNTYTAPGLDPKRELEAPLTFQMSDLEDGQNDFIRAEGGVVTLKKPARDAWTATLNNYYPLFIQEVSGEMGLKFEEMDDNMKKATVKEALKRTRAAAKKDMMYELGLE